MTNRQAYDMLTLIERTIVKIEVENKADTYYYDQIKSIEKAIHESCPELVDRWRNLKALIKSAAATGEAPRKPSEEARKAFTQACDDFDKWINANE